jgi:hypothetical protein
MPEFLGLVQVLGRPARSTTEQLLILKAACG